MDQSLGALFSGNTVYTSMALKVPQMSPETGIGPWMALSMVSTKTLLLKHYYHRQGTNFLSR